MNAWIRTVVVTNILMPFIIVACIRTSASSSVSRILPAFCWPLLVPSPHCCLRLRHRRLVSFHGHTNVSSHKRNRPLQGTAASILSANTAVTDPTTTMTSSVAPNIPSPSSTSTTTTTTTSHHQPSYTSVEMHPPLLSTHRFSHKSTLFEVNERPPNPMSVLTNPNDLQYHADVLFDWWRSKEHVICLTGAGLSTESGIPDYRGYNGSYHIGHKPMIHDHFMKSSSARQRYWGRGMVGWRFVDEKQPSIGHYALMQLEKRGKLGVPLEDRPEYYANDVDYWSSSGQQVLSLITQNVDTLHRRAGSKNLLELHGRNDRLYCMKCGHLVSRASFHDELEHRNTEWLQNALTTTKSSDMRADGDAAVSMNYDDVIVPSCSRCGDGFYKPDVVFFGDSVPIHRVKLFQAAVDHCDGILVVGSSLAVHSAFRHIKSAHQQGIPIAILNVGETRAEIEQLNVLKIEAPAGPTLERLVSMFSNDDE